MSDSLGGQLDQALQALRAGNLSLAQSLLDQVVSRNPHDAEALRLLAVTYAFQDNFSKALTMIERAINTSPSNGILLSIRGNIFQGLGQYEQALKSYDGAIALIPQYAEAHNNRANALQELGRFDDALIAYSKAITFQPNNAQAYNNRGNTYFKLRLFDEALNQYRLALQIHQAFVEPWIGLAKIQHELGRYQDAISFLNQALQLNPNNAQVWASRGVIFKITGHYQEALLDFARAMSLQPSLDYLLGNVIDTKRLIADWVGLSPLLEQMKEGLLVGNKVSVPFSVLLSVDVLPLQLKASSSWVQQQYPSKAIDSAFPKLAKKKLRIAYVSADFKSHPTTYLTAQLFEMHDQSHFEIIALSLLDNDPNDVMRQRLSLAFNQVIDVQDKTDIEVARLCRQLEIDIAVDLGGHTQYARTGIFAHRAAPIQVNFLCYPGTLGAPYMDYIIADHTLIPAEATQYYSEKIVYMPHCYQPNDRLRPIAPEEFTRSQFGLPEQGVVYCCFNNNFKITPQIYDVWMRILSAVPGSVLWLFEDNPTAAINLKQEAQQREVDPKRIFFAQKMPLAQHLARYRLVDLFLDTLPYNAHTTASDALWVGTPVLTCLGQSFAGRVAASLLKAAQLPELITENLEQYEALAIELGSHPEQLKTLKDKLMTGRLTCPLFDTALFTKHLEQAYQQMYERYLADLVPANMEVG